MKDVSITYFPVGNGDMSLITLSDKTDIIIDCNVTSDSLDESNEERYNVHQYLLKILKKEDNSMCHVDSFILSHPDEDHCRGFDKVFYLGDPEDIEKADIEDGLILIDELWFTPRVFSEYKKDLSTSAKAFYKEAERRKKLHKEGSSKKRDQGNRLRVIGVSDEDDLKGLEKITTAPGKSINLINGSPKNDFSFFIHGPFKKNIDPDNGERNDTTAVFQARFNVDGVKFAGLAFFGGDAGCDVWKDILEKSNTEDLQWDIFLAPHHCSWSFFSEEDYKNNKTPSQESIKILNNKREGAIIVCSCKTIKDDDDNPPHYAAAETYKKEVGEDNFYVTATNPNKILEFRMTRNGPQKRESAISPAIVSSAINSALKNPPTYG